MYFKKPCPDCGCYYRKTKDALIRKDAQFCDYCDYSFDVRPQYTDKQRDDLAFSLYRLPPEMVFSEMERIFENKRTHHIGVDMGNER